jgi:chitin synthase
MANSLPDIINFIYIMLIGSIFFLSLSLNQNNKRFARLYYLTSSWLGLYGFFIFGLMILNTVNIFQNLLNKQLMGDFIVPTIYLKALILFIIAGHAMPIIWTFSFSKWMEMLISLPSYIFYVPSYVNILLIFAFCRIDDLSWGTKGRDEDTEKRKSDSWKREKYIFVCIFMMVNILLAYGVCQVLNLKDVRASVIFGLTCLVVFLLGFRLVPALLYLLKYKCKSLYMRFSS